jgi:hypothetical protein
MKRDSPWVGANPRDKGLRLGTESPEDGIVLGESWFQRAGMSAIDGAPG